MYTFSNYRISIKKSLIVLGLAILMIACNGGIASNETLVKNKAELDEAIANAQPGDNIVMANGNWQDVEIKFTGEGNERNPITIKAETPGKVIIGGVSDLKFGGKYLIVDGLHFKNGHSPSNAVIRFKLNDEMIAIHCKVINCVIEDFNKPSRDDDDVWVQFWGKHNALENSYIAGKTNRGPTVRVEIKGNESINNYHQIVGNHFGPRPPKGGPSAETIQIGDSYTSMSPSYTMIANNLFEECNGEVEIISSKTNFNEIRNNVFYMSEGSFVARHGNYCTIDGNYFIGDGINENIGGVRIVNTGHWVTNNYFYNIIGENFRSPLAIMNGIPKSPLNRYNQVTDVVVAYNTYIDCKSPWQIGVGSNIDQTDVLPLSEIRSARPLRMLVANNLIFNEIGDDMPIVEHDKADGITFKSNVINNQGVEFKSIEGVQTVAFDLKKIADNIYTAAADLKVEPYKGFEFDEKITTDIFGYERVDNDKIGAILSADAKDPMILDKSKYGAPWYSNVVEAKEAKILIVTDNVGDLEAKIAEASAGDIISLNSGTYNITNPLIINKAITIQSKDEKVVLNYVGDTDTPLFELHPKGYLTLSGVSLNGVNGQHAFASLKDNMYTHFGLTVLDSEISNFEYALKVYKESFAERITFKNTTITNCANGLVLSEEIDDRGDYNAEYVTIDNCYFNNVRSNVIDYYRGGHDESTIGGNLLVANSTFINCGAADKNGILLKTHGIINVDISNNTFQNNRVKHVALLWGAKNNTYSDNQITNSGTIKVEENLEMKMMY